MFDCKQNPTRTFFIRARILLLAILIFLPQQSLSDVLFKRTQKLEAFDRATNDEFGGAIAIFGDLMAVGARRDDDSGINSGAVYLYQKSEGMADWVLLKKIIASDGENQDMFGVSLDLDGDTLVVGAQGANTDGACYVFQRNQGGLDNWGQTKKISATGLGFNLFGLSIGVSGDTMVAGTHNRQAAYVFQRNVGGNDNWGLVKVLTHPDVSSSQFYGDAVAISKDTVVVGEPRRGEFFNGAAHVFNRNAGGADNWGRLKMLEPEGNDPDDESRFGISVDIQADIIVVGAPGEFPTELTPSGYDIGTAYVFEQNLGGPDNWGEVTVLKPIDRVYDDDNPSSDNDLLFGTSVVVDNNLIAVGASHDDDINFDSGSTYVFERNENGENEWGRVRRMLAADRDSDHFFGGAVALSSDTLAVGAVGVNAPGSSNSGAVYSTLIDRDAQDQDNLCFIIKSAKDGTIAPICIN